MPVLKIAIAAEIPAEKIPELQQVRTALDTEFTVIYTEPSESAINAAAEEHRDLQVIIIPWTPQPLVTERVIARLPNLRLIISTYGGIKRNVAADTALNRGIRLTCTGAVRARTVAEFTLALMMDAMLNISRTHHDMRSGEQFPRYGYTRELTSRRIGIIGFGAVTRELLLLLKPFSNQISVHSNHAAGDELSRLGVKKVSLEELADNAEIVVLLSGLTEKTRHMIDADFLSRMRDDALLINTARGKLIDEAALIRELESGRLRAALDVYEEEPLAPESPLRSLENVVITAHSANSTREMDLTRWEFALSELRAYSADGSLSGELDAVHIAGMSDD